MRHGRPSRNLCRRCAASWLCILALSGCAAEVGGPTDTLDAGPGASEVLVGSADGGSAVCAAWRAGRADHREPRWSEGSLATCEAGGLDAEGLSRVVARLNFFRALAGLPAVTDETSRNAAAQRCALLMHANSRLDHTPPVTWACHDRLGAEAAALSNLATTPALFALDLYLFDLGVPELGHRRWLLSNDLGPVGVGSTDAYSCLHVIGGSGSARRRFTTWPPEGLVPLELLRQTTPFGLFDLDRAGWSVQSDDVDLAGMTVAVTRDGVPVSARSRVLPSNYGSRHALSVTPEDFRTEAGATYTVTLSGPRETFAWSFTPVDCAGDR